MLHMSVGRGSSWPRAGRGPISASKRQRSLPWIEEWPQEVVKEEKRGLFNKDCRAEEKVMVLTVAWSSLLGFGGIRWKCDLPPNTQGYQRGSRHCPAVSPGREVSEWGSNVGLVPPSPSPHPLGYPVLHVDRGRGGQMHRNSGVISLTSRETG